MKTFEYLTFQQALTDDDLNALGCKGWELVTHTAVAVDRIGQYYIFKRELNK